MSAAKERNPSLLGSYFGRLPCGKDGVRFIQKKAPAPVSNVFLNEGKTPLAPKYFGLATAINAVVNTTTDAKEIMTSSDPLLQKKLSRATLVIRIHLAALQTATYFVYISKALVSDDDVLHKFCEGIAEGFTMTLTVNKQSLPELDLPRVTYDTFRIYCRALAKELVEIDSDSLTNDCTDMGATTNFAVKNIIGFFDDASIFADNGLERQRLERIVARNGILLLRDLWNRKSLTYVCEYQA